MKKKLMCIMLAFDLPAYGAGITINIYDTASEKAIHTETVKENNSTYFLRVPQILILDEFNTCIVVLGQGISGVSTLITTFGFEG